MNDQQYIEWAEKTNRRWICHGHLPETAARWLEHLPITTPKRLAASARRAFDLVMTAGKKCDPKPWFYAGLFSLSSKEEQRVWLSAHPFTAAAVVGCGATLTRNPYQPLVTEDTRQLLIRIQAVLDAMAVFQQLPQPESPEHPLAFASGVPELHPAVLARGPFCRVRHFMKADRFKALENLPAT